MRYCMGEFHNDTSATLGSWHHLNLKYLIKNWINKNNFLKGVDFHIKLLDLEGKTIALQLWDT